MHLTPLLVALAVLLLTETVSAAASRRVPLREAVEQLRADGHTIVTSSGLQDTVVLELETVSLPTVTAALAAHGLRLEQHGGVFLIVVADRPPAIEAPVPLPTRLRVNSRGGKDITSLTVSAHGTRPQQVTRGADGAFILTLPAGTPMRLSAPEHEDADAVATGGTLEVTLTPLVDAIEQLIVTGTRHRFPRTSHTGSTTTLFADELIGTPALGGDSLRITNRLPGASSVGVSARARLRGGLDDEVLYVVDGIELLEPVHLADFLGIFSAIDDRTVDTINVYTGGFPARYGNHMSGVIDVVTLPAAPAPVTEIGLSTFSTLFNSRGATAAGGTEWLLAARHGNIGWYAQRVNESFGRPRYHDLHLQIRSRFPGGNALTAGAIVSHDDARLADGLEVAQSDIDARQVWLRLDATLDADTRTATTLSVARGRRAKAQVSPEGEDDAKGSLVHAAELSRLSLKADLTRRSENHLLEVGAYFDHARARYDTVGHLTRADLARVLGTEAVADYAIHVRPRGNSGGAYAALEFDVGDVKLQPGLRWDFQRYGDRGQRDHAAPRFGISWAFAPEWTARFDAGRYFQPEGIDELPAADGIATFSRPQRADHYIAGVEWLPDAQRRLRLQVYRKQYAHPKARFENAFNPFVLLPELERDRIRIAPLRAAVRGVDVEVEQQFGGALAGHLRYSHMDATDRIGARWVPRRWSQRHTVNAMLSARGDNWLLATGITWHSGWRTSAPMLRQAADQPQALEEYLNNTALRDFVALDVRASRSWRFGRSTITLHADIANVLARRNVAGIDFDVTADDDIVELTPVRETLLPLVPSVGVLIAF